MIQEISLRAWQLEMKTTHLGSNPGVSVASAAKTLNVTKQRVYQLIEAGRLDAFHIYDLRADGNPLLVIVTTESLDRFKASKPGKQEDLFETKKRRRVRHG